MAVNELSSWPERQSDGTTETTRYDRGEKDIPGVADAARERTQDAIDTLSAIMKDPKAPAAARISAAQAILDCGYGKPARDRGER